MLSRIGPRHNEILVEDCKFLQLQIYLAPLLRITSLKFQHDFVRKLVLSHHTAMTVY